MFRYIFVVATILATVLLSRGETLAGGTTYTVDDTDDSAALNACTPAPNDCSLRGAMNNANADPDADTIELLNGQTFVLDIPSSSDDTNVGGDLDILQSVTINGNGAVIVSGIPDRVIDVFPTGGDGTVNLNAMTVRSGLKLAESGGGIRVSDGVFNMDFVIVRENYSNEDGGGLVIDAGVEATITNSLITLNEGAVNAITWGGGLAFHNFAFGEDEGFLHIEDSDFVDNLGRQFGGGLGFTGTDAMLTMRNVDFTLNDTNIGTGVGGGVWIQGGVIDISGGTIDKNSTSGYGGGMYVSVARGTISDVLIDDNGALSVGGLYAVTVDSDLLLDGLTITNNNATTTAAGAEINRVTLRNSEVSQNDAQGSAGGVLVDGPSVTIENSTIASNSSIGGDGGGLVVASGGATLRNVTINANDAHASGGAVFIGEPMGYDSANWPADTVTFDFVTIAANASLTGAASIHDVPGGTAPDLYASIIAYHGLQPNCNQSSVTRGYNIVDDMSCGVTGTGDLQNTDPLTFGLAENGGPTRTIALTQDSPAIDHVVSGCPPPVDDQRGYGRPAGTACDTGAFEFGATPPTPSPTPSPSPSPTPSPTATPTNSPTQSPTASASPTPTGNTRIWGDADCDGDVDLDDALIILLDRAGLETDISPNCPLGGTIMVNGIERIWGDFDCSETYLPEDALFIIADIGGVPKTPAGGCPALRDVVSVS